jgi:hypothetical protein
VSESLRDFRREAKVVNPRHDGRGRQNYWSSSTLVNPGKDAGFVDPIQTKYDALRSSYFEESQKEAMSWLTKA